MRTSPPPGERLFLAGITPIILVGIALLLAIAHNRAFQVDEVEHLHAAYNLRDGRMIYRDFWQGHPPLLHALLIPITDVNDPVGTYRRSRIATSVILLATLGLTAFCAARLSNRTGALLAAGLALFYTTFIERGIEVRPDALLALLVMASLAVEVARRDRELVRFALQSLFLGTGMLFTQKAIFATFAFGCLWLVTAWKRRRPRLLIVPVLLWFLPFLLALAVMVPLGNAREFLQYNVLDALTAGTEKERRFGPLPILQQEARRNFVFLALAAIATVLALARKKMRTQFGFAAFLAVILVASIWANPFPWPYVHVPVIPALVVVTASVIASSRLPRAAMLTCVFLAAMPAIARLAEKSVRSADLQFATLREVQRITDPSDTAFDLAGLYFQPDAYPFYAMSGDVLSTYQRGRLPRMTPFFRRNRLALVMFNYRMRALGAEEKRFLTGRFVHYWGYLFVPGVDLGSAAGGTEIDFDVLKTKPFRYEGAGRISVDGHPFSNGTLAAGVHRVRVEEPAAKSRLIFATPLPYPPPPPGGELYVNFD